MENGNGSKKVFIIVVIALFAMLAEGLVISGLYKDKYNVENYQALEQQVSDQQDIIDHYYFKYRKYLTLTVRILEASAGDKNSTLFNALGTNINAINTEALEIGAPLQGDNSKFLRVELIDSTKTDSAQTKKEKK